MIRVKPFVSIDRRQNLLVFWKFKYLAFNNRGRCTAHHRSGILSQIVQPAPNPSRSDGSQTANSGCNFSWSACGFQSAVNEKIAIHNASLHERLFG